MNHEDQLEQSLRDTLRRLADAESLAQELRMRVRRVRDDVRDLERARDRSDGARHAHVTREPDTTPFHLGGLDRDAERRHEEVHRELRRAARDLDELRERERRAGARLARLEQLLARIRQA